MFKNTASQKLTVFCFDSTTNLPKTGDAANLTAYRDIDDGGVTVLTDTSATEKDATNAKGYYIFDLTQAETNGDKIMFSCKSSTANIVCIAVPAVVYTLPATGILAPTVSGRTLDVSAGGEAGVDWANVGSPTTSLALTGTTIASTQKVDIETIKTNPVVNAGTVTFPTTATLASTTNITAGTITTATNVTTVNGLGAGVITASSIAADAITDAKVASDVTIASVTGAVGSVTGNVGGNVVGSVGSVSGAVGSVTGNVGGNVTGSVGSVAAGGITAASIATDAIDADALAADAVTEIAAGVWGFVVQGTRTATKAVRLMLAALTGKASGLGTATAVYRNPEDTIDAITATVDASGNRTAVTLDDSA